MEQIDFRFPLLGAFLGALLGAAYHWLARQPRRRDGGVGNETEADPARQAEQARRVSSFVERAARTMVAYSRMVDAANADDGGELQRLFRALRAEQAEEPLAELQVDDRAVREAARAFLRLDSDIAAKVEGRLAAGQTVQIGGELRLRAAELGKAVDALNNAAARLVPAAGRG